MCQLLDCAIVILKPKLLMVNLPVLFISTYVLTETFIDYSTKMKNP